MPKVAHSPSENSALVAKAFASSGFDNDWPFVGSTAPMHRHLKPLGAEGNGVARLR